MTTPGDFEVSLSAKHRRLLKINRFKNIKIKIKLQGKKKKIFKKLKNPVNFKLNNII